MKIWCKLLGHDFDRHWEEVFHAATTWVYHSEKCLRCGIDIHDVYTISPCGSVVEYEYKKKEEEEKRKNEKKTFFEAECKKCKYKYREIFEQELQFCQGHSSSFSLLCPRCNKWLQAEIVRE